MLSTSVFGLSGLFLTMVIFHIYHPEYVQKRTPSVSRAAAFDPSADVFTVTMCIAALCSVCMWVFVLRSNLSAYRNTNTTTLVLAWLAAALNIIAAISLALLAIVNSNWNGHLHEMFSISFFFSQIIGFIFDSSWLLYNRKNAHGPLKKAVSDRNSKLWISAILVTLGLVMLTLYLIDKNNVLTNEKNLHTAFAYTEYVICVLCYLYPLPLYREHFSFWRSAPVKVEQHK